MVKLWAFHLPQFHPIPENDLWWGKGFTEWCNVKSAKPAFPGHQQPHHPTDGYYDLRDKAELLRQARQAQSYGIFGFVFYHYWFQGRRLLEKPVQTILQDQDFSMPFCLCWANESWTRRWDGMEDDVLLQQSYSVADDLAHIRELISVFKDERYFKHNGRPVLLVYRSEELPDPKATARMWRREVQKAGFDDIYLLRVEGIFADIDPTEHGFDAAIEFAPDWRCLRRRVYLDEAGCWSDLATGGHVGTTNNRIFLYEDVVNAMLAKEQPDYKRYPGVFPAWDNSARRQEQGATIIHAATPATYQYFLEQVVERTRKNFVEDDQLIFINAWNEWGEGCHLEADLCHGAAFLESTYHVLNRSDMNKSVP